VFAEKSNLYILAAAPELSSVVISNIQIRFDVSYLLSRKNATNGLDLVATWDVTLPPGEFIRHGCAHVLKKMCGDLKQTRQTQIL